MGKISAEELEARIIPGLKDYLVSQEPGHDTYLYPERENYLRVIVRNDYLSDDTLFQVQNEAEILTALTRFLSLEILAKENIRSYLAGSIKYPFHNLAKDLKDLCDDVPLERTLVVDKVVVFPFEVKFISHLIDSYWDEYCQSGTIAGFPANAGLSKWQKLPRPIYSIRFKFDDENGEDILPEEFISLCGQDGKVVMEILSQVFQAGFKFAESKGVVLLEAKFDIGKRGEKIRIINDLLTAHASMYVTADNLANVIAAGDEPELLSNMMLFERFIDMTLKEYQQQHLL